MSITSVQFIAFVIGCIVLFAVFPKKYKWVSLLISSVAFYAISDLRCILFVLLSSFTVWLSGVKLNQKATEEEQAIKETAGDKTQKKAVREKYKRARKRILLLALLINVGILVVLKICNYLGISPVGILTGNTTSDAMAIIMPLGISYYTFSVVGYILDVYWKRYAYEPSYLRFLTWTIYFPHIVQGPISRYNQLGQELKKELSLSWINFKYGIELILWGCFKKLVIADRISIFINTVYADDNALTIGCVSVMALVLDAVQIYTDFSGYVDIVTGVSQIFGVKLEKNFNRPFMSRTVPEFWRRWHMSLGGWFKDYVYYPVSVSRVCKKLSKGLRGKISDKTISIIVTIIPVMCTWILTGLWHGTGIGYVAWGIYYGTLITISVVFSDQINKIWQKFKINTDCFSFRLLQRAKIFCIFMGGRFLANRLGMGTRITMIKSIFTDFLQGELWNNTIYSYGVNAFNFIVIAVGVCALIIVATMQEKFAIREEFEKQNFVFKALVLCFAFFVVFLFGVYGTGYNVGSFMYQQF